MAFNSHKWIKSFKRSRAVSRKPVTELLKIAGKEVESMDTSGNDPEKWSIKYTDGSSEPYLKHIRDKNKIKVEAELPDEGFSDPNQMREAFIGPFVFGNTTKDDELKAMYDGALDGYANYKKGMVHPRSDYKRAYQAIEKLLKRRGIQVESFNEDSNIFSADDEQSWPSGPFGKKDDYADEAGSSYKRAKDWQIDKPGEDEATKGTGYKA